MQSKMIQILSGLLACDGFGIYADCTSWADSFHKLDGSEATKQFDSVKASKAEAKRKRQAQRLKGDNLCKSN